MSLTKVSYSMINGASVNVLDFGADPTGVTSSTAAIQAAIATNARTVWFPSGTYLVTASLTQAANQSWVGEGGQRATTLKKGFNGDLMTMGTLGEINSLNFDGNGATYTGKNIVVPTGCFSPKITRVRTVDSTEQGLYFQQNGGIGAVVTNFEGTTTDLATVAPIGCQGDTTAAPRFFENIWLAGGLFAITGMNDTFINNAFVSKVVTSPTTTNYYLSNTRFASSGGAILIQGAGGQFSNCAFAGTVTLANTSGLVFDPTCEFGAGIVEDAATCLFNSFATQSTAYTPTWTQPSGVQPSLGNGTLTGRYIRQGRQCTVQIELTMGSTTTFGNSSVAYQLSLPFTSHNAYVQKIPLVCVVEAAASYTYNAEIDAQSNKITSLYFNGQSMRDTSPVAWVAGNKIVVNLTYSTI
jgi:hypothetical protein